MGFRAAVLLACAIGVLGYAGSAQALSWPGWSFQTYATQAAAKQGWSWQVQRSQMPDVGPLSGIPEGDIAVAWVGMPDKIAYLRVGGRGTPSLEGARLELAIDAEAPNSNAEGAELRGCPIVSEWEPGEPMAWDRRPLTVCDPAVEGRFDRPANAFRFDLSPLAGALASAAVHGISIEPIESPSTTFQVVFKGVAAGGVSIEMRGRRDSSTSVAPSTSGGSPTGSTPSGPAPESHAGPRSIAAASSDDALLSVGTATPDAQAPRRGARPFGLGGVYAGLAALAVVLLVGRILSGLLRKERP